MNIRRKAFSIGTSAALLASLLTAIAAPAAFAANTSSGGGTIYPAAGASANGALTFAEDAVDQFTTGGGVGFTVAVYDNEGTDGDVTFSTSVAPTVTRNAGVGSCSAGFVADTLVVSCSGMDDTKIDSFTVSGLKVSAGAGAALGAVIFDVTVDTLGLSEILATASGATDGGFTGSGVAQAIDVTLDAGSPDFDVTGTACDPSGSVGKATLAASGVQVAESVTITATDGSTTMTGVFLVTKPDGVAITQSVCATRFPSFATVGDAVDVFNQWGYNTSLQAGVNSQNPSDLEADLGFFDGLLLDGDTVTFTIDTAGVVFSPDPELVDDVFGSGMAFANSDIVLSADRKSITVTLTEDTEAGDFIDFGPHVDVALGVPNGTTVDITVTTSRAGVVVLGNPVTVAVIGFVVAGSTSAPTVFIGQNDQSTGMVTLVESAAGSIPEDTIEVCLESGWEDWSFGRYFWAVVTSGDLKLNVAGLAATQGKMTIDGDCLEILVYTASTVASTIEIRDGTSSAPAASGATNGPKVNVDNDATPGPVYVDVVVDGDTIGDNIIIAIRAYTGTPVATAASQPFVQRGQLNQLAGNITITEGAPNQFDGFDVELCIVPPSVSDNGAVIWSNPVGANAPVVSTNSITSGLIAVFDPSESGDLCLELYVDDFGGSGLGTITVSNLRLDVKADAPLGAMFVRIYTSFEESGSLLQGTVSPAIIAEQAPLSLTNASALGVTTVGPFSNTTKVQATGKYITWRFVGGSTLANKTIQIWTATKNSAGVWSAFTKLTSRKANAAGNVYYYLRSSSAKWISVRGYFPGDTTTASAWSPARQGRWR